MSKIETYPTLVEVFNAGHLQICKWYKFLRSPKNRLEIKIINKIVARFDAGGGMTPSISKEIGLE